MAKDAIIIIDEVEAPPPLLLKELSSEKLKVVDTVLTSYGAPSYGEIKSLVDRSMSAFETIEGLEKTLKDTKDNFEKELVLSKNVINGLNSELLMKPFKEVTEVSSLETPEGCIVEKDISEVFPNVTKVSMKVPVWVWSSTHPEVPEIDEHYIFREDLLINSLHAILSNKRMYLQGHTGTGKTTLIEQIAARLNWPFARINFDSEITRMDLIGRDTLKDGESVFVDGVLPKLMSGPYITMFDEIDFCRPDVAYVMQAVLEGNSFRITEDGGRLVKPHPMFRMFASGNTVGQGDEEGLYQGARPQSLAFLDRFTLWGKVEYLDETQRKLLLKRHCPTLSGETITTICDYVTEHLVAFQDSKILQPISPRGMIAIGQTVKFKNTIGLDDKTSIKEALYTVVLNRSTKSDYSVLKGIIDRVLKE